MFPRLPTKAEQTLPLSSSDGEICQNINPFDTLLCQRKQPNQPFNYTEEVLSAPTTPKKLTESGFMTYGQLKATDDSTGQSDHHVFTLPGRSMYRQHILKPAIFNPRGWV